MKNIIVKPINYNLTFEPDLKKFTFKGKEILTFGLTESAKKIELDAVDLKIHSLNCGRREPSAPRI